MLQVAWKAGRLIDEPGILCVANPSVKALKSIVILSMY